MKISEALEYLQQVKEENGDLRLAITLPGWALGRGHPEALMHAFDYGVFVIDQTHRDANGNEAKEKVCSVGFVLDRPMAKKLPALRLVKP
jgi:hypothetical protein